MTPSEAALKSRTHVNLDGNVHKIANVEDHPTGPGHTHRVHLGCGMTIDVDVDGARAKARAIERMGHVEVEMRKARSLPHLKDVHKLHSGRAAEAESKAEKFDSGRWLKDSKAKGCPDCEAHEAGAPAVVQELGHTPATTTEADIDTNLACPVCGTKIYKRRIGGAFACSGQGHEFDPSELVGHLKASVEALSKIVTPEK